MNIVVKIKSKQLPLTPLSGNYIVPTKLMTVNAVCIEKEESMKKEDTSKRLIDKSIEAFIMGIEILINLRLNIV